MGCYGDGGAVFTDDLALAEAITSLRSHGRGSDKYDNRILGINSRMDTLQAAILLEKLNVFAQELDSRRRVAAQYQAALSRYGITPLIPPLAEPSWAQYTLRLPSRALRDALKTDLEQQNIPITIYYPRPLHLQGAFAYLGIPKGSLPRSEEACERVLSLPMHAYLTDNEVAQICTAVVDFLERRG